MQGNNLFWAGREMEEMSRDEKRLYGIRELA